MVENGSAQLDLFPLFLLPNSDAHFISDEAENNLLFNKSTKSTNPSWSCSLFLFL